MRQPRSAAAWTNRQASRWGSTRTASPPLASKYDESPSPCVWNSSRSIAAHRATPPPRRHVRDVALPCPLMAKIGYAAMLEQFHPTALLDWCVQAEAAGFEAGFMVSEHFHPWTPQQGQAAFAWSFMGALELRTSLRFGTAVTYPGGRYHPAVIAHAAATLGAMFPGRFWLGLGPGQALDEHI